MPVDRYELRYTHAGKACMLAVEYGINTDPVSSGFEIVRGLVPDLNICIGYPTMHAYVKEHEGFGFCRYCGFIQTVTIKTAETSLKIVDVSAAMAEKGIPFFCYGYPAQLYDAPVNNYGMGKELTWQANTYLVDMPSFANGDRITYLAGFSWGYKESENKIERQPFALLPLSVWQEETAFLTKRCAGWRFE